MRAPGPPQHYRHVSRVAKFSAREIRSGMRDVEGFNAKLAVLITRSVGTMACAYAFAILSLVALPSSLGSIHDFVQWVSTAFLQLVLLSIIMVGQRVGAATTDAQAATQFADVVEILDRLDTRTDGGLKEILDEVRTLRAGPAK